MPIVGRVFEAAGVVLIDRRNTEKAIEAMMPLVDAMRVEGKSVCLSPEGTRSITDKLAPFKKGAFHLAMQAGVPIVPIVIHNSNDVQPKGDLLFHPGTVNVEVLPPIDTSSWSAESIDRHVADVRAIYLQAMEQ
jgi:putative phosphoserine phosphatase/1-acylglycerol-3-phosphate O-acyltransferase